ncbi:MGMT family protein [candidate division KSB1 bacterium]|nr:MGMT family protein [candidate division KSB1 bacterium]
MPAVTIHHTSVSGRQPWAVKMQNPAKPRIVDVPLKWRKQYGNGTMLIATPRLVEAKIREVRKGRLTTLSRIRRELAAEQGADSTCPLTTGIFLRIVAEFAEEERAQGMTRVTPYWRVVKDDGSLNPKFPGGIDAHANMLRAEGVEIILRRGVLRVTDVEAYLSDPR